MELARRNATRLLSQQSRRTMSARWAQEWLRVLDEGVDVVADVLVSREPYALELRQNSPFAGALDQGLRIHVLRSFNQHWRDEHAERTTETVTSPVSA